jgi:hypothetical protein
MLFKPPQISVFDSAGDKSVTLKATVLKIYE